MLLKLFSKPINQNIMIFCNMQRNKPFDFQQGEGPGSDPEKWKELFKAATVN